MAPFRQRFKDSRLVQAVVVYLGVSWVVLQVVGTLRENLDLPRSVFVAALVLLAVGLVVVAATAWVQSRPGLAERASAEEVPEAWELDAGDLFRSLSKGRLPHLTWARALTGGGAAFLLLFGLAGLWVVVQDRGESFFVSSAEASVAPGIAVMPFSVSGPDAEVWREGMMDLLSTNLDGVGGLRTIHTRTVLARWRERSLDETADLDQVLAAARATGARLALVGSAVGIGSEVRLRAELYDLENGSAVSEAGVEGPQDDVLTLIDELSIDVIRQALVEEGDGGGATGVRSLESLTTGSLPALRAYLEGEALYRHGDFVAAARAFETAVARDSLFAMAWHRLAAAVGWTEGGAEATDAAGQRARELAHRLPPRDSLLLETTDRVLRESDATAIGDLRAMAQRYPDDPEIWYWLGEAYNHAGDLALVPVEDMGEAFETAIALDSTFAAPYIHAIESALSFHDMDEARSLLAGFERYGPGVADLERMRFMVRFTESDGGLDEALAATDDSELYNLIINIDDAGVGTEMLRDRLTAEALRRRDAGRALNMSERAVVVSRAWALLARGKIDELRALLPRLDPTDRAWVLVEGQFQGGPAPEASAIPDGDDMHSHLYGALVAAQVGEEEAYHRRVAALRALEPPAGATPGELEARLEPALVGLEAWASWHRGGGEPALVELEAAHRAARRGGEGAHLSPLLAYLLERAYTELGRPEDALPYARSHRAEPLATFRTARLYEALGRDDEARRLYPLLEQAWNEADATVPEVAEARERWGAPAGG